MLKPTACVLANFSVLCIHSSQNLYSVENFCVLLFILRRICVGRPRNLAHLLLRGSLLVFQRKEMDGDSCLEVWDAPATRRLGYDPDFEFSVGMSNLDAISEGMMLSADELFFNGTLLPLHHSPRLRIIQSHTNNSPNPALLDRKSTQTSPQISSSSDQCSVQPPAGGYFAPPSPEAPRCSITLRDLFGANKSQAMAIREASGKSLPSSKLWKHLLRGLVDKKPTEGVKSTLSANFPAGEESPSLQSSSSSISRSTSLPEAQPKISPLAENRPLGHAWSLDLKSVENLLSPGKMSEKFADDSNMFQSRKKKTWSSRSVSMPGSRWGSPERESGKVCSKAEKFPSGSSGRVNSGKIIMKNLERCSTNQKPPLKYQDQCNGMRQRENWRGPEKVSSYSSNVRVTPVLSVPLSLAPSVRANKLSKGRFSSFMELFLSKKETPFQVSQK